MLLILLTWLTLEISKAPWVFLGGQGRISLGTVSVSVSSPSSSVIFSCAQLTFSHEVSSFAPPCPLTVMFIKSKTHSSEPDMDWSSRNHEPKFSTLCWVLFLGKKKSDQNNSYLLHCKLTNKYVVKYSFLKI